MKTGKTIRGILSYNENKVKEGVASCLAESGFGCPPEALTFHDKLNRFEKLLEHNPKVRTNAIHISLNFDVSEKIPFEKLVAISSTYMDKIGFGQQPYLVYQHRDAAHPHIHIVTTNIQQNGKRIDLHNIGKEKSEPARKEIEQLFHLVQAQSKTKKTPSITPINIERAIYGRSETKRSISNSVELALTYKLTSLVEFNAILRQFNVMADRGKENMMMFQKKGLVYCLLDKKGNKVGVPIKASSIYCKPTLPNLEKLFAPNQELKQPFKDRVKGCIDKCFQQKAVITQDEFNRALEKAGIYVLLRQSKDGRVYGITFVDNQSKVVFNGSELGKPYSAKALLEKISDTPYASGAAGGFNSNEHEDDGLTIEMNLGWGEVVSELITAKRPDYVPSDNSMKRRKKKKKKGLSR